MHYDAKTSTVKWRAQRWLIWLFRPLNSLASLNLVRITCFVCLLVVTCVISLSIIRSLKSAPTPLHMTLSLPTPAITVPVYHGHDDQTWKTTKVGPGDTLSKIFQDLGLSAQDMKRVLSAQGNLRRLTHLQVGDVLSFDIPHPGQLRALRYDLDPIRSILLTLDNNTYKQQILERDAITRVATRSAEIKTSLWDAAHAAGLSASDVSTLTDEMFKYDIDFDRDLRPGDHFNAVVREIWREGERLPVAQIEAATFTVGKKTYSAFRYLRNGKVEYFDVDGRPLKKPFIRMPIPFARLTSTFGMRLHPVLGKMRVHKGVDYAAAMGTPIMAAGDAKVQFVGTQRGYGNFVVLDHGRGYSTLYAHMSRFGKIKRNQHILQGTTIGYVGMTGMATGPHLHYEFRVNGEHRNPLTVTMPPSEPLHGTELVSFREAIASAVTKLAQREKFFYASNNKNRSGLSWMPHG